MAVLWLLLRVRWRRAFAPALAVALLIGGIGGFVLASAAAAMRVETAYGRLADEIDAPDVAVIPAVECGPNTANGCHSDDLSAGTSPGEALATIRGLDVVEKVRLVESVIPFVVDAEGTPIFGTVDDVNGCFDGDRSVQMTPMQEGGPDAQVVPFALEGELPIRGSATVVITRWMANRVGLSIGDEILLAGWCSGDGDPMTFAAPINLRVSGLSIGPLDLESPGTSLTIHPAYVDPVAFEAMIADGAQPQQNIIAWFDPSASRERVEEALSAYTITIDFRERHVIFDEALQTDANLLWLIAIVGALAGLLVLAPIMGRNLRDTGPNTETLAALGTQRRLIAQQGLAHICSLAVLGALTAAVVAIPVSAWMPNGLASAIHPEREYWFDGMMTLIGVPLLIIVVVVVGSIPAWRIGRAKRSRAVLESASDRGTFGSLGLRPAVRTGVSAAVGAPVGPRRASPWPSLVSMIVAAIVGTASLTYLAGLRHLEETPPLLGWNWDAIVSFDFFEQSEAGTSAEVFAEIEKLADVEQVTGGTLYPPWFLFVADSGLSLWPWAFATGPDAVTPAILTGRAPQGSDEVAVDALFMESTGLGIGDSVSLGRESLVTLLARELAIRIEDWGLDYQLAAPPEQTVVAEFEITGVALMPTDRSQELPEVVLTLDGYADLVEPDADELAATRAWLPTDLPPELTDLADDVFANLDIDDRVVYVRFSGDLLSGVEAILSMPILDKLTVIDPVDGSEHLPLEVVAPTPPEVMELMVGLNIESNDRVPVALAIMVAVAFFALATYLLFVSIRSRRFEMAVMRALGLSTGGVRWSVAAQATATAAVAVLIALPVGVVIGRLAWLAYARELEVQPVANIPWATLAIVFATAIVVANVVALIPGWFAARRSPGFDLRSE